MAYTEETQYNSPNFTPAAQVPAIFGRARTIDGITIHHWGDPRTNPTYEGVVSYLCRASGGSSAHAVATGTGRRVAWIIDAVNAAWHSGSAIGNATTIGLELDPRCRDEDYDVAAELIADIWKAYGRILPLYPHKYWSATACPGNYDLVRLELHARQWYDGTRSNNPKPAPKVEEAKPQFEFVDFAKKMIVAQESGARVRNISTGKFVDDRVIPKGTEIDILKKTTVGGVDYLISKWASERVLPWGIRADELSELVAEKPVENTPKTSKIVRPETQKDSKNDMSQNVETPDSPKEIAKGQAGVILTKEQEEKMEEMNKKIAARLEALAGDEEINKLKELIPKKVRLAMYLVGDALLVASASIAGYSIGFTQAGLAGGLVGALSALGAGIIASAKMTRSK